MSTLRRAYNSLFRIRFDRWQDALVYRASTTVNLTRKLRNKQPASWHRKTLTATALFEGLSFRFYVAENSDYNVFMNPYFHEFDITGFVAKTLKPDDVFVDVGAHAGLYSILAALKGAKVYSFEPNSLNLNFLASHLKMNGLEATVFPKAVSDYNGAFTLYYCADSTAFGSNCKGNRTECVNVEAVTLDSALRNVESVSMLKIDAEGCDYKVLKGAAETLRKTKFVITESCDEETTQLLETFGFKVSVFKPSGYLLASQHNASP